MIDYPQAMYADSVLFWKQATNSTLSPTRGDRNQWATLIPPDGTEFLKVQDIEIAPRVHLDLHVGTVADVISECERMVSRGASVLMVEPTYQVLASPGGAVFCVVQFHGQRTRPKPVGLPGHRSLVDQVAIDCPPHLFAEEVRFWSEVTGWAQQQSSRPEFTLLGREPGLPFRILLHRLDASDTRQAVGMHLDFACENTETTAASHEQLGAQRVATFPRWITMRDPGGLLYCLTQRNPDTGVLES